jgi:hypothetical protein
MGRRNTSRNLSPGFSKPKFVRKTKFKEKEALLRSQSFSEVPIQRAAFSKLRKINMLQEKWIEFP